MGKSKQYVIELSLWCLHVIAKVPKATVTFDLNWQSGTWKFRISCSSQ